MKMSLLTNKALVVTPGAANYFYDQTGKRIAEALLALGWTVRVETLATLTPEDYDWCFLVNLNELIYSRRNESDGMEIIAKLRTRCRKMAHVLLECATTHWFLNGCRLSDEAAVDAIFDFGLHSQLAGVPVSWKPKYRFVFNGLTRSELREVDGRYASATRCVSKRPIPWAVIGHQTGHRVRLADRLIREFDPRGFCYLPGIEPVTESGPHLNEEQFQRVLEQSRYHVWCSHHAGFYLEGERFRASLLAGAIPLKVMLQDSGWRRDEQPAAIFDYLILDEADFPARMRALDFHPLQERFISEFRRLPDLAASLADVCHRLIPE